jgi:LmbE family N-acetylglucosaminyl deacetylase
MSVTPDVRPRMLAVLAHPDDESFGMGGTLAFYADCGAAVSLICATGGEAGDVDEQFLSGYQSKSERREAELQCATEALGLESVFLLGYRDSGMPNTPDNEHPDALVQAPHDTLVAQVVYYIRKLRPHVVLTFDPIGGYRHPDHIAIQKATVDAFYAASDASRYHEDGLPNSLPPYRPQKLYFHTFPRRFLRMAVRLMPLFGKDPRHFGRNGDIDLTSIAVEDFPVHAIVDYLPLEHDKKTAALCHASQGGGSGLMSGLLGWIFRVTGNSGKDTFMRDYPKPVAGLCERDLFDGVEID